MHVISRLLLLLLYFLSLVCIAFLIDVSSSLLVTFRGGCPGTTNPLGLSVSCLKTVLAHRGIDMHGLIEADELRALVAMTGELTFKEIRLAVDEDAYETEAINNFRSLSEWRFRKSSQTLSIRNSAQATEESPELRPFKQLSPGKFEELVSQRNNEAWLILTVSDTGTFSESEAWLRTQLRLARFAIRTGTLNCSASTAHSLLCNSYNLLAPSAYLFVPSSQHDLKRESDTLSDTPVMRIYQLKSPRIADASTVIRWVQQIASRRVPHVSKVAHEVSAGNSTGVSGELKPLFVYLCPRCEVTHHGSRSTTGGIPLVFGALAFRLASSRIRFAFAHSIDDLPIDVVQQLDHDHDHSAYSRASRFVLIELERSEKTSEIDQDIAVRRKFLSEFQLAKASFSKRIDAFIDEAQLKAFEREEAHLRELKRNLDALLTDYHQKYRPDIGNRSVVFSAFFDDRHTDWYLSFNQLDWFVRALVPDANDYFVALLVLVELYAVVSVVDYQSSSTAGLLLHAVIVLLVCNLVYFCGALALVGVFRYLSGSTVERVLMGSLRRVAQCSIVSFGRLVSADSSLFTIEAIAITFAFYFVTLRFFVCRRQSDRTGDTNANNTSNNGATSSGSTSGVHGVERDSETYRSVFMRDGNGTSMERSNGHRDAVVLFDYPLLADQRRLNEYLSKLRISFFNDASDVRSRSPSPLTSNSEEERDQGPDGSERPTCSICIERFRRGQVLCTLPCEHRFHELCVLEWLFRGHLECPLCRWPANKTRPKLN